MQVVPHIIVIALFFSVAAVLAGSSHEAVVSKEMVDRINSAQNLWHAATDTPMSGITQEEAYHLFAGNLAALHSQEALQLKRKQHKTYSAAVDIDAMPVPDAFDARDYWPMCTTMKHIRDQSNCGACFAFAAAESMSDRECIFNKVNVEISSQAVLSCGMGGDCDGGFALASWNDFRDSGFPTESCLPYSFPWCDHGSARINSTNPCLTNGTLPTPMCNLSCVDGYPKSWQDDLLFGQDAYHLAGEQAFQLELMTNGPFEVAFQVHEDFMAYRSGIYTFVEGKILGGHNVKIVGWGVENGVKYWTIANSWNAHWGENGFFRMLRGVNQCGVESDGTAGKPKSM